MYTEAERPCYDKFTIPFHQTRKTKNKSNLLIQLNITWLSETSPTILCFKICAVFVCSALLLFSIGDLFFPKFVPVSRALFFLLPARVPRQEATCRVHCTWRTPYNMRLVLLGPYCAWALGRGCLSFFVLILSSYLYVICFPLYLSFCLRQLDSRPPCRLQTLQSSSSFFQYNRRAAHAKKLIVHGVTLSLMQDTMHSFVHHQLVSLRSTCAEINLCKKSPV